MKYYYSLLLSLAGLLISSHSLAQGSVAALDAKNGFKGYTFGSSIDKCKGLIYYGAMLSKYDESFSNKTDWYLDLYNFKTYKIQEDYSKIGDLKINSPWYCFFDGRLMRAEFSTRGSTGKELILLYKSLYGNPKVVNGKSGFGSDIVTYLWQGKKVSLNVTYCASPYQGSTVLSGQNTTNSPWLRVIYLSLPMLSEMKTINAKAKNQLNESRASDL